MQTQYKILTLCKKTPFKDFFFSYPFAYIAINKIIIDSLFGLEPNAWFKELSDNGYFIKFTCGRTDALVNSNMSILSSYISPFHRNPIIEFEKPLIVPEANKSNSSTNIFYNYCKIELMARTLNLELDENIKVSLYYETTPGVVEK